MKFIVALLLIFMNVYNFVNSQCSSCGQLGQPCDSTTICGNDLTCRPNGTSINSYSINSYSTFCLNPIKEGQQCFNDDDRSCEVGLVCSGTCQNNKFAQVGESCTRNEDCAYSIGCFNGKCARQVNNANCGYDSDCYYGSVCYNKQCTNVSSIGSACNSQLGLQSIPQCLVGSVCVNDKCVESYSQPNGANCSSDLYCTSGYCNPNSKQCGDYSLPTTNNCTVDGCDAYHTCSCDGKCYPSAPLPNEVHEVQSPLYKCAIENKCHLQVRNLKSASSCVSKHCNSQLCDYTIAKQPQGELQCENSLSSNILCNENSSVKLSTSLLLAFGLILFCTFF